MSVVFTLFSVTFIAVAITSCQSSECPDEWLNFQDSCYYFGLQDKNWYTASAYCQSLYPGAELVQINSQVENDFLVRYMQKYRCAFTREFWIDGTDMITDGKWVWAASQEDIQYFNWKPNEPNGNAYEDCINVNPSQGGWNDQGCYSGFHFVCEVKKKTPTCESPTAPVIG